MEILTLVGTGLFIFLMGYLGGYLTCLMTAAKELYGIKGDK